MKLIAAYSKGREVAFVSHLDVLRTLQRAFRRANVPLAFSQGFNPHPLLSFATATGTGMSSDFEWFEVQLSEEMTPNAFVIAVNGALPNGFSVRDAFVPPEGFGSLASKLTSAIYEVQLSLDCGVDQTKFEAMLKDMLSGEIIVNKRTKSGIRPADIRPQILRVSVEKVGDGSAALRVLGKLQADGGLRVELFIDALNERFGVHAVAEVNRAGMFFAADGLLPRLPAE